MIGVRTLVRFSSYASAVGEKTRKFGDVNPTCNMGKYTFDKIPIISSLEVRNGKRFSQRPCARARVCVVGVTRVNDRLHTKCV